MNLEEKFTKIYDKNLWHSNESKSGKGSELKITSTVRIELIKLINTYKFKSILDAPCGDFNWMKEIIKEVDVDYLGCDIVKTMINNNNELYQTDKIKFQQLDITKDQLPDADLLICRDCLVHLSYEDIKNFLKMFKKSNVKYVLLTSFLSDNRENLDLKGKMWRPLNFTKSPLNLIDPEYIINEYKGLEDQPLVGAKTYNDKALCLWHKNNLRKKEEEK